MCKTIKQKVKFNSAPMTIYQLLTDSRRLQLLTGEPAVVSKKVGGSFWVYSQYISGINVDFVPGQRIVQAWRSNDFPAGVFSMVTIQLHEVRRGQTELVLIHRGVPKALIPSVEASWKSDYWQKIKIQLAGS